MGIRHSVAAFVLLTIPCLAEPETQLGVSPPNDFPLASGGPDAVALADIDLDGRLDAVVAVKFSGEYQCFRGVGDGTFAQRIAFGYLGLEPSDLVVDDFNRDGLPDIAAVNNACG